MGSNTSAPAPVQTKPVKRSAEVRQAVKEVKLDAQKKVETKLDNVKQSAVSAMRQAQTDEEAILASQIHTLAEQATTQLQREGNAFTKADYIAILCRLNPQKYNTQTLNPLTVDDLRSLIRRIIYDVDTIVETLKQSTVAPKNALENEVPMNSVMRKSERATATANATAESTNTVVLRSKSQLKDMSNLTSTMSDLFA